MEKKKIKLIPKNLNGNRLARINEWKQKEGKIAKHLIKRPTLQNMLSALSHYMNSTGLMTPPTEVSGVIAETPFIPDAPNAGKLMKVGTIAKAIEDGINNAKSLWKVAEYPGYQLKGLMKGSLLEKQLSKNGTININLLNAYFNKASNIERDVVNKVLSEKFNGLKTIDYNLLKKAVLDELIGSYNRVPLFMHEGYGMGRLGFQVEEEPALHYEYAPGINTKTFTFESPRLPYGNTKHFGGNPLGHSRTYTLPEEPHTLYVMESQSDWAQNYGKRPKFKVSENGRTNVIFDTETLSWKPVEDGTGEFYDVINDPGVMNDINNYFIGTTPNLQSDYLAKNYSQRQLQENLRYAAENGLTKMRYPTSETAAKIEGYVKQNLYRNPEGKIVTGKDALQHTHPNIISDLREDLEELASNLRQQGLRPSTNQLWIRMKTQLEELESPKLKEGFLNIGLDYPLEHQTILKKYADFPKLFLKLYKGLNVRTVTDSKGNTWFEVDVPENYLNSEWQFKFGGKLYQNKK